MFRLIGRILLWILEKLFSELALIAALLSLAQAGGYLQRILGGSLSIVWTVRSFAVAFYHNENFSTVIASLKSGMDQALDGMTKGIQSDPQTALVACVVTFIAYKIFAALLRFSRRALRKGTDGGRRSSRRRGKDEKKGKTFDQLYEAGKPAASHVHGHASE